MYKTDLDKNTFINDLLATHTPCGREEYGSHLFGEYLKDIANITKDRLGNTYANIHHNGTYKVMLEAHIDEIGLKVTHITKEGYLKVCSNGGVDASTLPGSIVNIIQDNGNIIEGVIGKQAIHLQSADERSKVLKLKDLYIDIGVNNEKEAWELVSIGNKVVVENNARILGDKLVSKGLDDKIGVFIIAEVLRELKKRGLSNKINVCAVATTQEEVGLRGATVAGENFKPDVSFSIDVGFATDTPNAPIDELGLVKLGGGSIINAGCETAHKLLKHMIKACRYNDIPYQLVAGSPRPTGTNTNAIQLSGKGVTTALVSIPNRYMHTQVEMVSIDDITYTVNLLVESILAINIYEDFI